MNSGKVGQNPALLVVMYLLELKQGPTAVGENLSVDECQRMSCLAAWEIRGLQRSRWRSKKYPDSYYSLTTGFQCS